jgi:hypothetical protein
MKTFLILLALTGAAQAQAVDHIQGTLDRTAEQVAQQRLEETRAPVSRETPMCRACAPMGDGGGTCWWRPCHPDFVFRETAKPEN